MNRIKAMLTAAALAMSVGMFAADVEKPIITIYTDAYREIGPSNAFRILLGSTIASTFDIDFGWGPNEYDVEQCTVDPESGLTGTWIPAKVSSAGVIRIYGDATLVDALDVEGAYITNIEMEDCKNIEVLALEHNTLQELDLTPFHNLYAIYLSDNPFTAKTPLVIGKDKPYLSILEIDITGHVDPLLNFSDYPSLQVIDAYASYGLSKCDVTGCPNLLSLSLEMTAVSELDVTKNPNLVHLNISESRITEIDLSQNPYLQRLYAGHSSGFVNKGYELKSIDLSNNPMLFALDLGGNNLGSVDLSKNTKLTNLVLSRNKLSALDLTANTQLYSVNVFYNDMDFATLPAPGNAWGEYFYRQNAMPVPRVHDLAKPLDMAKRVLRDGTTTGAYVMRKVIGEEDSELDASLYSYKNGLVTFKSAPSDSVYVVYTNTMFPDYNMMTTPFMVKAASELDKPSLIASVKVARGEKGTESIAIGMLGATPENPKKFYVQEGNTGELVEYTATASKFPSIANTNVNIELGATGSRPINIYMPEGEVMTSLRINGGLKLESVDVTAATELEVLELVGCGLEEINLVNNRCLQELDLSGNQLTELDLQGAYGDYEKHVLSSLVAENNKLTSVNIVSPQSLHTLALQGNELKEFSLKDFDNIEILEFANNKLEGELNLAYLTNAKIINLSGNNLSGLTFDTFENLEDFRIWGNKFDFNTIPEEFLGETWYWYAPQQPVAIQHTGSGIDLSKFNIGNFTTFEWFKADGTPVAADDLVCEGGKTQFINMQLGEVYCVMTNPKFPQMVGENALRTTNVLVAEAPTNLIAEFTTLNNSDEGVVIFTASEDTELYIDWRGDGVEFLPYNVSTTYKEYDKQVTYAGADVKVYAADDAELITVFSVNNMPLGKFDGSKLTGVECLTISGAGLTSAQMVMPESSKLFELNLGGNKLSEFPWAEKYPNLNYVVLNNNEYEQFDATKLVNIGNLILSNNKLTTVKFANDNLWNLALENNELETINLKGLPSLNQLFLTNNQLSTIDLSPVKETLNVLSLVGNRFTFSTLPVPADYPRMFVYYYAKQAEIEAECIDGKVDLSSQAMVGTTPTQYYWFYGDIVEDTETGEIGGELLIEGEEYTIEDGVTTFLADFVGQDKVTCVMLNEAFPNCYMRTPMMECRALSGVETVVDDADATVDVYTVTGVCVRKAVKAGDATRSLPAGIYIVGGRKVLVK